MPTKNLHRLCGREFGSFAAFETHLLEDYTRDKPPFIECLDPVSVGLVEKDGVWYGHGEKKIEQPKEAFETICGFEGKVAGCGKVFYRTPGRGRPATRCPECRKADK